MSAVILYRGFESVLTMCPDLGEGPLGTIAAGAVAVSQGRVTWVGSAQEAPGHDRVVEVQGGIGMPALVDCHTHAIWAGSRADEWRRRLAGEDYSAILEAGGGILSTVRATREASLEALVEGCAARLRAMRANGVGVVEVKSGYGLTPEDERKLLLGARRAAEAEGVRVRTTFLGAHTVPAEHRGDRSAYVKQVIEEQLPRVVDVADAIDVYVDRGAFTVEEGRSILEAGRGAGLDVRVHAEQVTHTGAARMAAELGARSADHLEHIDDAGIAAMAEAGTVGVLLPGAMLYLRDPPPPVAALRAAGVSMAVATDYNPGTSPVDDLWTCATLAVLLCGLTVEEALLGITVHGAKVLSLPDQGVLRPGAAAPFIRVARDGEPATVGALLQHLGAPRVQWLGT